jgi:hypothetical protein
MWRTTPFHRSESEGSLPDDAPPPLRPGEGVQPPEAGAGPLFHRVYRARIRDASLSPEGVIAQVTCDLDRVAPTEFASFNKVWGGEGAMAVGDEYVVRMPGPWDGPVRVVHRTPTSFRFATLTGHLEAGQIEFRARTEDDGDLLFEIESWARAGDRLSHLLYNHLRLAKEIQLNLWTETCLGVARGSGGRLRGGVRVSTRRVPGSAAG